MGSTHNRLRIHNGQHRASPDTECRGSRSAWNCGAARRLQYCSIQCTAYVVLNIVLATLGSEVTRQTRCGSALSVITFLVRLVHVSESPYESIGFSGPFGAEFAGIFHAEIDFQAMLYDSSLMGELRDCESESESIPSPITPTYIFEYRSVVLWLLSDSHRTTVESESCKETKREKRKGWKCTDRAISGSDSLEYTLCLVRYYI